MTASKTVSQPEESAAALRAARFLKIGAPVGVVTLAIIAGAVQGPASAILVLAGGALLAVIATFWTSMRTLFGETTLSGADAYAIGAPRAEEEQKQAVLRALKDLEFERSVGKISEEDYKTLVAKYRAEAKRLLRLLDIDVQPRRAHAEALVKKRLVREGLLDGAASTDGPLGEPEASGHEDNDMGRLQGTQGKKKRGSVMKASARKNKNKLPAQQSVENLPSERLPANIASTEQTCGACATVNDSDASFCKKCGARLLGPAERDARADVASADTPDDGAGAR